MASVFYCHSYTLSNSLSALQYKQRDCYIVPAATEKGGQLEALGAERSAGLRTPCPGLAGLCRTLRRKDKGDLMGYLIDPGYLAADQVGCVEMELSPSR